MSEDIRKIAKKRITATMIHGITAIEDALGDLWGEFKDESIQLTKQEEEMLEKFLSIRKSILDYGNYQIRLFNQELTKITERGQKNG